MRRSDREITDFEEICKVMGECDVLRIALNDTDGYPYLIPLNFGMEAEDGKVTFYFHSALEGHKLDLIREDARAAFEMDCKHVLQYQEEKCYCTMAYDSVCGRGRIHILSDEEKIDALRKLMKHYHAHGTEEMNFNPATLARTCAYCMEVEQITGKRKLPKPDMG